MNLIPKTLSTIIFLLIIKSTLLAQWTNGQAAEYVIGQPDFTIYSSGVSSQKLYHPSSCAIDITNGKLYIVDNNNGRVLRFAYPVTSNNPTAERVFGWNNMNSAGHAVDRARMYYPWAAAVYNGTLWVADGGNRILKFNNAHSASTDGPNADGILGKTSYEDGSAGITQSTFNQPAELCIDSNGNLWVADSGNNRILKFNNVNSKSNGADADLVLGQSDFITKTTATSQSGMNKPLSVCVSGTNVWVAEMNNNRVLRFANPTINGQSASQVLGQTNFNSSGVNYTASTLYNPVSVAIDNSGRLYVSDSQNGRIMIYNDAANKGNGGSADNVLGTTSTSSQNSSRGGTSNFYYYVFVSGFNTSTSRYVEGVYVDNSNNKLFVADRENNRVMQFASSSALPVELISFTAELKDGNVELNWQTATEINNYGFNVECRVKNEEYTSALLNANWKTLGFVHGHGNSNSPKDYSFVDQNPLSGKVKYRLKQIDFDGSYKYSNEAEVICSMTDKIELSQNFPNPFNPVTKITFTVPQRTNVELSIYDIYGRLVKTIFSGELEAGNHSVDWNGTNNLGYRVSSNIYFYKMKANDYVVVKKMILVK